MATLPYSRFCVAYTNQAIRVCNIRAMFVGRRRCVWTAKHVRAIPPCVRMTRVRVYGSRRVIFTSPLLYICMCTVDGGKLLQAHDRLYGRHSSFCFAYKSYCVRVLEFANFARHCACGRLQQFRGAANDVCAVCTFYILISYVGIYIQVEVHSCPRAVASFVLLFFIRCFMFEFLNLNFSSTKKKFCTHILELRCSKRRHAYKQCVKEFLHFGCDIEKLSLHFVYTILYIGKLTGIPATFYYLFLLLAYSCSIERTNVCIETILFLEIKTGTFNKKAIMRYGYGIWNWVTSYEWLCPLCKLMQQR